MDEREPNPRRRMTVDEIYRPLPGESQNLPDQSEARLTGLG